MNRPKVFVPAIAIIFLLAIVAVPSFFMARKNAHGNGCLNNLRMMDSGMHSSALANRWALGEDVDVSILVTYIKGARLPECPSGGEYWIPRVGMHPTCSKHGGMPE